MKRIISNLTMLVIITAAFVSCDKETKSTEPEEPKQVKGNVEMRVIVSDDMQKYMTTSISYVTPGDQKKNLNLSDCTKSAADPEIDVTLYSSLYMLFGEKANEKIKEFSCYSFTENDITSWSGTLDVKFTPLAEAPYDTLDSGLFCKVVTSRILNGDVIIKPGLKEISSGRVYNEVICGKEEIAEFCEIISDSYEFKYEF